MVLQSIVLYSILILIMVTFSRLYAIAQKNQKLDNFKSGNTQTGMFYLYFIMFTFSLMMGLRYDVGTDYFAYQGGYIYNYDVGKGEVIFNWIREYFNNFNLHYSVYFAFLAFLNISFFLFAFKKEAFVLPLLLLFLITNGDWLFWMNGMRQAIAMCIWIYALTFIVKKKIWLYLFWCIIAIGFHTSAIILIPLYWILKSGKDYFKSVKLQLVLFASAFIIQFSFSIFLTKIEPLIDFYQAELSGGIYNYSIERFNEEASAALGGSGIAYVFRLILSVIIIVYSAKLKRYYANRWFNIIYFLFFIGLLTENIFPAGSTVLTRPFRYFFIFRGIMFAYFVYYLLKRNHINYKIVGVGMIFIFIAIFYLSIISANEYAHIWYKFYFEK